MCVFTRLEYKETNMIADCQDLERQSECLEWRAGMWMGTINFQLHIVLHFPWILCILLGFPCGASGKESACQ